MEITILEAKNQLEFSKRDKHKKLREEIFKEIFELGKLGQLKGMDEVRLCNTVEYMDLSDRGAMSVTQVVDFVIEHCRGAK